MTLEEGVVIGRIQATTLTPEEQRLEPGHDQGIPPLVTEEMSDRSHTRIETLLRAVEGDFQGLSRMMLEH